MPSPSGWPSPRLSFWLVFAMLGMVSVPAYFTLHTAKVTAAPIALHPNPSPYGYTVSLLLFIIPIVIILFWLVPQEGVKISKKALLWTIGLLFPLGAALDFFFASLFFTFPNAGATLGIGAPALHQPVPIEEYVFYFTGFLCVVLLYVWFDEYWLAAYTVPGTEQDRIDFDRLLRFHPQSLILAAVLIGTAFVYRRLVVPELPGFPGYFMVLVLGALLPSSILLPSARPVVNWRAFSLTMFMVLLISLLWEVTLALPYGWWNFQDDQMIGLRITAWARLPIEEVLLWVIVSYATVLVYETVKRWKASGRSAREAFLGARE
jgi:lycopene cyclase domain-containing protein